MVITSAIASTLLEPQSISDVTERLPVFKELLAWLVLLSQHCSTAALIAQPIMRLTRIEISSGTKKGIKSGLERRLHYAAAPSPRELQAQVRCHAVAVVTSCLACFLSSTSCPPASGARLR